MLGQRREREREREVGALDARLREAVERGREPGAERLELLRLLIGDEADRRLAGGVDAAARSTGRARTTGFAMTGLPALSFTALVTYAKYVVFSSSGASSFHWSCCGDVCGMPAALALDLQLRQGVHFGVVWIAAGASDLSFARPTLIGVSEAASMRPWSSAPSVSEFSLIGGTSVEKPSSVFRPQ